MMKLSTRDMCHISIFVVIIAVCAQISIPMPMSVPLTLQTFAIPLSAVVLGTKKGMIATLTYILLGLVGVPVFANFSGGIGMIFGRTGGFILSFPLMVIAAGVGTKGKHLWLTMWLAIGAAINYFCGMLMFSVITSTNLTASFVLVVAPFIPTSILKIIMVVLFGKLIKHTLEKNGILLNQS